jgi:DNA segregation ATPase FtsK/SpoIIIE, S-DNA-T family
VATKSSGSRSKSKSSNSRAKSGSRSSSSKSKSTGGSRSRSTSSRSKSSSSRGKSTGSRSRSKTTSTRSRSTSSTKKQTPPAIWSWKTLSLDRKLDIVGVGLALVGLLTLLSLASPQNGRLTGLWMKALNALAGWGTFILPLALIIIGLWLVFRKIEKLPTPSLTRMTGIILLYLAFLTILHLIGGGGWDVAKAGQGGGHIGAAFERLLVVGLGNAGAWIVVIAWALIAISITLESTIADVVRRVQPNMQKSLGNRIPGVHIDDLNEPEFDEHVPQEEGGNADLPPDFHVLPDGGIAAAAKVKPKRKTSRKPKAETEEPEPEHEALDGASSAGPVEAIPWVLPDPAMILDPTSPSAIQENVDQEQARVIEETLAAFNVPVHVVAVNRGPTVTQFGVEPDYIETNRGRTRVRVNKITTLQDDLALALAAQSIRIQAPVPGHSYVGIEVPNVEVSLVALLEGMKSKSYKRLKTPLRFVLGKDVSGQPRGVDLAKMPHLLIAGTTGSGKSVCVNAILTAFLLNNSPANLRLVLVDPKRVELTGYNGIPHLLSPVITDAERVVGALQWMQREMDSRYHKFSKEGVRNITEYNKKLPEKLLPHLVVVIDELADLMMLAPDETERSITRLAQLARATGIHLILATQRPSVNVVTGLIKANFPARIAFAVASGVDSRVILDQPGAERLLGRGDMLFQAPDASSPVRIQGVFVSESETQRLVEYWRGMAESLQHPEHIPGDRVDDIPRGIPLHQAPLWDEAEDKNKDTLYDSAVDLVRREGRASITMLQRRMRIGYTRAARLVDAMEEAGIISPNLPNSQSREVWDYGDVGPPAE